MPQGAVGDVAHRFVERGRAGGTQIRAAGEAVHAEQKNLLRVLKLAQARARYGGRVRRERFGVT